MHIILRKEDPEVSESYKPLISLENACLSALKLLRRVCLQLAPEILKAVLGLVAKHQRHHRPFTRFLAFLGPILCQAQEHTVTNLVPRHKGDHQVLQVNSKLGENCPSEVAKQVASSETHMYQREFKFRSLLPDCTETVT